MPNSYSDTRPPLLLQPEKAPKHLPTEKRRFLSPRSLSLKRVNHHQLLHSVGHIVTYIRHIQQHAGDILNSQQNLFAEMRSRLDKLDDALIESSSLVEQTTATVSEIRKDLSENMDSTSELVTESLEKIALSLAEKTGRVNTAMKAIDEIGLRINLLSLNASVEAARAGEHGAGFAIVAEEVRMLANLTMENCRSAESAFSLSDIQHELDSIRGNVKANLVEHSGELSESLGELNRLFQRFTDHIENISENRKVLTESVEMTEQGLELIGDKEAWGADVAINLERILKPESKKPVNAREQIAELAWKHHICIEDSYDRLNDVLQRKELRVAIEPNFKGLSFRKQKHTELCGLDVDYARMFARWLGVNIRFVEHQWDLCPQLLFAGRRPEEPEADLVWSALPPNISHREVAYSESYTQLHYVLARRIGDTSISSLSSLNGRVLGCINDPAALATLEDAGVRWASNRHVPGGSVHLANLIAYSDQSKIHDCLSEGKVDAFAVDLPIYHWACSGSDSPWRGKIETIPGNLATENWYYAVGVANAPSSYRLLKAINHFLKEFSQSSARREIEQRWQGTPISGYRCYRDEPGRLPGESELKLAYESHCRLNGVKRSN